MRSRILAFFLLCCPALAPAEGVETPALLRIREALAAGGVPLRMVCFGDSVTGIYYHSGGRSAYPELIAEALRRRHPTIELSMVNAGMSGHTTSNAVGRLQQHVLVHRPHLVFVMFGLNDVAKGTPDLYRKNLVEIVRKCRAAGAEVILGTPNAVAETPERPIAKVAAFAAIVRAVSAELEVPLCDPHAEFEALRTRDPGRWRLSMSDEIHPNLRGHRLLARCLLRPLGGEELEWPGREEVAQPLAFTEAKLAKNLPVRVLAMPPADRHVGPALEAVAPGARAEVTSWPVDGLGRAALVKDASRRVREFAPDLVVVSVPRAAAAMDREEFIRTQMWIVNHSLSRGKREWDVVVVHPDVYEPESGTPAEDFDALVRSITPAQDVGLIDRENEVGGKGEEIFAKWIAGRMRDGAAAPNR